MSLLAELGTIAALVVLFLLESPKVRTAVLGLMPPERSERTCPEQVDLRVVIDADST